MTSKTCMVVGCDRPYMAKGYCHPHYYRKQKEQTGPIKTYLPTLAEKPDAATIARFESFGWTITETGCWEWNGRRDRQGYGLVRISKLAAQYPGRRIPAHRLSHEIHNGPISQGFVILHACDNPPCVNPGHLRAGTASENFKEMWTKGRNDRQRLQDMASMARETVRKISEGDVRDIRRRWAEGGVTQPALATEYGISKPQIYRIIHREQWKHVV